MQPGSDGRRFAVHDHRPNGTPGGGRQEPVALEVRHTTAEGARQSDGRAGDHDCVLRIERHACVAAVSDDDSADRFLARLLLEGRPGRSVCVYGHDTDAEHAAVERLVGVVPPGMPLPEEASVHDVLVTAAEDKGLAPDTAAERATDLTDALDLKTVEHTPVAELTPGQRSRTALGCALPHVPGLLLLSLPLDDVDSVSEKILSRALSRYTASTGSVLFSTRSQDVAHRIADRQFTVRDGEVSCRCRTGDD
ncbi:hypothetical protein RB200_00025 [Streptomyces sp. PmtG]